LPRHERTVRPGFGRASLDLDEGENASPPGDKIDLANRRAYVASDNSVAGKSEPPGAQCLGQPAEAPGEAATVER
jgi:hypothetical protein